MELIQSTESYNLEYKREIPSDNKKWLKTVVAFANGKGGQIVFGIDDETHTVMGVSGEEIARTIDKLTDTIINNCTPQIVPEVRVENIGDKHVIVVEIEAGQNTPYYLTRDGIERGTYIRAGATTRVAEAYTRLELILKSKGISYDQYIIPHETPVKDTEIEALCKDIQRYSNRGDSVTKDHLISWGLLRDEEGILKPSVAFNLLTGSQSVRFSRIQCGVFLGDNRVKFQDSKEFSGPLYQIIKQAEDYVLQNTRTEYVIKDIVREEVYEIPLPALREIIVNAVLHRNYLYPAFIQIAIHPSKIEFFSPGGLYGSMTKERMLRGNCSALRNPLLADMLQKMGMVERWGSGIGRIFEAFAENGLPAPEYVIDDLGVTVSVPRVKSVPQEQTLPVSNHQAVSLHGNPQNPADSNERLLQYIRNHPNCTYSQLLKEFGFSRRTLSYKLEKLREQGFIVRTGATRSTVWNAVRNG